MGAVSSSRGDSSPTGGRGKYCCVPGCKSSFYDCKGNKTGITFFSFPKNRQLKKRWLTDIKRQEHRDGFVVSKYTKVCERHFQRLDIRKHLNSGRKTLMKENIIPSNFSWTSAKRTLIRKSPKKRSVQVNSRSGDEVHEAPPERKQSVLHSDSDNTTPLKFCKDCVVLEDEMKKLRTQMALLVEEKIACENENNELKVEVENLKKQQFNSSNIRQEEEMFKSFTGLPPDKFDVLFEFLHPAQNASDMRFYETFKKNGDEPDKCKFREGSRPSGSTKLHAIEQLFMFLVWLRCGFGQKQLAWLFGVAKSTVSRYLITWSNYMYFSLGSIPTWPSKDQVVSSMPACFKETYPSTRCIIDCTDRFLYKYHLA